MTEICAGLLHLATVNRIEIWRISHQYYTTKYGKSRKGLFFYGSTHGNPFGIKL